MPDELADIVIKNAKSSSVRWGGKAQERDYPDVFRISVSREAWLAYYGHDEKIACRIADLVVSRMQLAEGNRWSPEVSISRSDLLPKGGFEIASSFSDHFLTSAESLTPVCAENDAKDDTMTHEDGTPALMTEAPSLTLVFDYVPYSVQNGNTLGVRRHNKSDPDIVLPTCEQLRYVSNIHASFHYADSTWSYAQHGRNGVVIVHRGGKREELRSGDRTVIDNGDRLVFPHSSSESSEIGVAVIRARNQGEGGTPLYGIA